MNHQQDRAQPTAPAPIELGAYRPSGHKPDPFVLIEGTPHSGQQFLAAELAFSDRVGRCWWLDLDADAELYTQGTPFEIIAPGTWDTMTARVELLETAAIEALEDEGLPPLVVVNSVSTLWLWTQLYAASLAGAQLEVKKRRAGDPRNRIDPDPYTAVTIPGNLWDEAHHRYRQLTRRLRALPAIVVLIAQSETHTTDKDGRALPGGPEYRTIAHRDVTRQSNIWVRTTLGADPRVISVADRAWFSAHGRALPEPDPKLTLEELIFDSYGFRPPETRSEAELPQD